MKRLIALMIAVMLVIAVSPPIKSVAAEKQNVSKELAYCNQTLAVEGTYSPALTFSESYMVPQEIWFLTVNSCVVNAYANAEPNLGCTLITNRNEDTKDLSKLFNSGRTCRPNRWPINCVSYI